MTKLWLKFSLLMLGVGLYAVIRYNYFGGVAPAQIPVFIGNKICAVAAVACVALLAYAYYRRQVVAGQFWLKAGGTLALLHVLMTLSILNSSNYKKFFLPDPNQGQLSLLGQGAILAGVLAVAAWWKWLRPQDAMSPGWGKVLVVVLIGAHVTIMGFAGWFTPEKWPGGMPSFTIYGAIFVLAAVGLFWARRR